MLNTDQMDQVRVTYEKTCVVYVDPDIPKTNPFDLLVDLIQAFASHLRTWTIDSCELMRSILTACDMMAYDEPPPANQMQMNLHSMQTTANVEDDLVALLWHGRAHHARSIASALAQRLCRIHPVSLSSQGDDTMSDANLLRLEVLVHPLPLRGIFELSHLDPAKNVDWSLFIDPVVVSLTNSPLNWIAYGACVLRKHIDKEFHALACEKIQMLSYFMAAEKIGSRMPVSKETPMIGEYQPYWAVDFTQCPRSFDASDFFYVFIHDLMDKFPKLIQSMVGRRILRGIVLYAGERLALEFLERPLPPHWDSFLAETTLTAAMAPKGKRPLSPTPPEPQSEDETEAASAQDAKRAKTDA